MLSRYPPPNLTPQQFEKEVRAMLDATSGKLVDYRSELRELVSGPDGEYVIDVTVRFEALGMSFLVLVECKHLRRPVERAVLQTLNSKVQSIGAHKGVVFSTSGFQSGALDFALAHGIATVHIVDGRSFYRTKSLYDDAEPPAWLRLPTIGGWLIQGQRHCLVSAQHGEYLGQILGFERAENKAGDATES